MLFGGGLIYLLSPPGRSGSFLRIGMTVPSGSSGYGLNYGANYGG